MSQDEQGLRTQDRIRILRKKLGLTQQAFGERLGVKRNTVTTWETGRNAPIDVLMAGICREFHVRREWLEDGVGPMFDEAETDQLDSLVGAYNLGHRERVLIERFLALSQEQRDAAMDFFIDVANQLQEADTVAANNSMTDAEIEARVSEFREGLLLEKRLAEQSEASQLPDSSKLA